MTVTLLAVYLSLHAGFAWARIAVFRIDGRTPAGVRVIELCATVSILGGGWILWEIRAPYPGLVALGLGTAAASAALFRWGLTSVRRKQLTAAFSPDVPTSLVTSGPYRYIRHPFYLAYLLGHAIPLVSTGSIWAVPGIVVMATIYAQAAIHEERKFLTSRLARAWRLYSERTGRFLPRLDARRDG